MGPKRYPLLPFDDYLDILKAVETLPIEHLVSQLYIERLLVSILAGTAWFKEQSLDSNPPKSAPDHLGIKLEPVV